MEYSVVPSSVDYHPTMDMGVLAATLEELDKWDYIYVGEADVMGGFSSLAFPLEVGRVAVELGKSVVVPACSAHIVALTGAEVYGVADVTDLLRLARGEISEETAAALNSTVAEPNPWDDLVHIHGQEEAKWALEVAVAGGHNLLLVGPPGEGKSSLAQKAYTIMPPLSDEEALEVTTLWQAAGRLSPTVIQYTRPCIEATKQTTPTALLGGGDAYVGPRPGLVSLAHKGILLADEFFEWGRPAAESLRIPLQDKVVNLARRDWQYMIPADFQLIATANPCPCGYWKHPRVGCRCTGGQRRRYLDKMSGPIFDRIDIRVEIQPGDVLGDPMPGRTSKEIAAEVRSAVATQAERFRGMHITRNAEMTSGMYDDICNEMPSAREEMGMQRDALRLSSRGVYKLRGLARTIADLAESRSVEQEHVRSAGVLMAWSPEIER
ncbi:MAG TPA: ATP-binding protein [Armatimonadota bacterium]|jgi:magnesium chelatase family protein